MRDPRFGRPLSRRDFLRRSAGTAAAIPTVAALLAACGHASNPDLIGPIATSPAFALARPDHPVTWPIQPDNQPIDSGLQPEQNATLKIYNWADYLWKGATKAFAKKYGCTVEISTFNGTDEALAKLRTGDIDFDVYFPDPSLLGKLVTGKLVRPLNHDYLPNLSNVWPSLQNPFYDQGSRYTVPYTIYSSGIGWRNDHVTEDIASMSNPYEIYWDEKYRGKVHLLDDYRETLGMALLKNGITDLNTDKSSSIALAKSDLLKLVQAVNVKLDVNDYTDLPEGASWIHQSWSGDIVSAQYYLPKGIPVSALSYWAPTTGVGAVGSDNISILKAGKNPVLAHLFLNYMLDSKVAFDNFYNFVGYQPPMNNINPDRLVSEGVVPKNLESTVVRPEDFDRGQIYLELSPSADNLWHSAFQEFSAGV